MWSCGAHGPHPTWRCAAGSWGASSPVGNFTLGVTLPQARRRGYWAAMAHQRLAALPRLPAAALFSDMSRPDAENARVPADRPLHAVAPCPRIGRLPWLAEGRMKPVHVRVLGPLQLGGEGSLLRSGRLR